MGKTTRSRPSPKRSVRGPATLVTIDKVDANPTGLLKKILAGLHVDDKGTNKQRFDCIVTWGVRHIFLIDQIHNLR